MTERERLYIQGRLALLQGAAGIDLLKLPSVWESLCECAAASPVLGEAWLERQQDAIRDVRAWLARLQEGDDE